MESDELFDYISDLPNDNVLEICNFVLIGGSGGEAGVGCGEAGAGCQEAATGAMVGAGDSYDMSTNTFQEHNFVEVMDFRAEDNNNNNHHTEEAEKTKVRLRHLLIKHFIGHVYNVYRNATLRILRLLPQVFRQLSRRSEADLRPSLRLKRC